eukprot:SAG11_NODE_4181_length_2025_cov_1.713396_3_plen_111_part_00
MTPTNAMAWDLARAWERLTADTLRAYPSAAQRRTAQDPGYWLTQTSRDVVNIGRLHGKVQKRLSKGLTVLQRRDVEAEIHESRGEGYAERVALYEASKPAMCGKIFNAQP